LKPQVFISVFFLWMTCTFSSLASFVLDQNTSWRFNDSGNNLNVTWKDISFNDASWLKGKGEFGFGDSPITPLKKNRISYYFRKKFELINPPQYDSFIFKVRRDDGIVIYLNGAQIFIDNMPASGVNHLTPALGNCIDDGDSVFTFVIPSAVFINGTNVLAVEVHNATAADGDLTFDLTMESVLPTVLPVISRGPYLQSTTPSSTFIQWRTDIPSDSKVSYGLTKSYGNTERETDMVLDHSIQITGLLPNTKYYYKIGSTAITLQQGEENYFYTAPFFGSEQKIQIWAIGDFGKGSSTQYQVLQSYIDYLGGKRNDMWIWLGDNAYNLGLDSEYGNYVFDVYQNQFKNWNFYPALGNHDYAQSGYLSNASLGTNFPYFNIFNLPQQAQCGGVPSGSEKYYSYDWGNVHFIALDSYGAYNHIGSPMYRWLLNDLQINQSKWIIAYWHHPPFSKGTHDSDWEIEMVDMRENIVPLLERFGVDLVLTGHSHTYERSYFMHGHYGVENTFGASHIVQPGDGLNTPYYKDSLHNGTVYMVCGVAGSPSSWASSGFPHNAMVSSISSVAGSASIEVKGDTMHCKFLQFDGSIGDEFYIIKDGNPRYEWSGTNLLMNPKAFPNPSSGVVKVYPGYPVMKDFQVFNQLGALLFEDEIVDFKTIDFQFLGKGTFEFLWSDGQIKFTQTVVIH
jgi:Calcineurin-like phosphoesterase